MSPSFLHSKTFLIAVFAAPLTAVLLWLQQRVDWDFGAYLLALVMLDTLTGVWRAIYLRSLSSSGLGQLFTKVTVYFIILLVVALVTNYHVRGKPNLIYQLFDAGLYAWLIAREALSILENVATIQPGLVPKWLLARLSQFTDSGDPLHLKPKAPGSESTDITPQQT